MVEYAFLFNLPDMPPSAAQTINESVQVFHTYVLSIFITIEFFLQNSIALKCLFQASCQTAAVYAVMGRLERRSNIIFAR